MYHSFLIYSSDVLAIINSAAMNTGVHVSFSSGFLGVHAQQWDCWVIWQFYFQFFKEYVLFQMSYFQHLFSSLKLVPIIYLAKLNYW